REFPVEAYDYADEINEYWTNVYRLVPNNKSLYPVALRTDWSAQFNDWSGTILLLAQDGCPTALIRDRVTNGESSAWRYGEPGEKGSGTNRRLYSFASMIPDGKL